MLMGAGATQQVSVGPHEKSPQRNSAPRFAVVFQFAVPLRHAGPGTVWTVSEESVWSRHVALPSRLALTEHDGGFDEKTIIMIVRNAGRSLGER